MQHGTFHNFYLPYQEQGALVSPEAQALQITRAADALLTEAVPGVGILYSANYGQTREIERTYRAGLWDTGTGGSNQAAVMTAMENLLTVDFAELRGRLRILPITTMNAYFDPVPDWNADVLRGIVVSDLARVAAYLYAGWHVLGWQNQETIHDPQHPYAIGGGIATLPPMVDQLIQSELMRLAADFAATRH
jgi:hypothetical protein